MGDVWDLDGGNQHWIQEGTRFVAVRPRPTGPKLEIRDHPELDGIEVAFAPRCATKGCARLFPGRFKFCPFCRTPLRPLSGATDSLVAWNAGIDHGLGETSVQLKLQSLPTMRDGHAILPSEAVALPAGGDFAFVSVLGPERLYAFARASGVLYALDRLGNGWIKLLETGASDFFPRWSWACAVDRTGFAIVTEEGPGWVALPWQRKGPIEWPDGFRPEDECLGGPGLSDSLVAAPVLKDSRLALCWRSLGHGGWAFTTLGGAPQGREAILGPAGTSSNFFAAPAQDARGNLYWAGRNGYIFCDPELGQLKEAGWVPWPKGRLGVPQHRPAADGSLSLYQLTVSETPEYFVSRMTSVRGRIVRHNLEQRLRGPFFSRGQSSFYENQRFRTNAWDLNEDADIIAPEGTMVLPLQIFGVSDETRQGTQLIYARAQRGGVPTGTQAATSSNRFVVDVVFDPRDQPDITLLGGLSVGSPFDLSLFLHQATLHLYDAAANRLYRFPLRAETAP
ncbi:MAG: hypothetical protein ACHQF3_00245 [Alphaproteobacteria bacterium]